MKYFTVYNDVGQILQSGQCADNDYDLQKVDGQFIIELATNPATQYIQNGEVVAIPPKPDYESHFDYASGQWVGDTANQESVVISRRNGLLYASDWTQLPNNPLTPEAQQQWADYRQQLRDITTQPGYPFSVVWPTAPQG
jgi:Phage tail assembly chaperone protein